MAADPELADGSEGGHEQLELTSQELSRMHEEVMKTRIYSARQREQVLSNLHAMTRNVGRLRNGSEGTTANNLREALRIRLSILNDNVQGFVSSQDIDRRDRYSSMGVLLDDVANDTSSLPPEIAEHMNQTIANMRYHLTRGLTYSSPPAPRASTVNLSLYTQVEPRQTERWAERPATQGC